MGMKREVLCGGGGGNCCLPDKPFIALQCRICIFPGVTQQRQMAQSSGSSHWLEEGLLAALHCLYYWPWTTFVELLRVSTGTAISFFGNFIVRQPAFCVCCYHCSQLMFLTLFLASSVSQGRAQEESMKSLALLYALFLLVCYVSQE